MMSRGLPDNAMADHQHLREGARSREAATVQRCSAAADHGGGGRKGHWGCSDEPAPVVDAGGALEEQRRGGFTEAMFCHGSYGGRMVSCGEMECPGTGKSRNSLFC